MTIDPITREVIQGWLDNATEAMQAALIKTVHEMLITRGRGSRARCAADVGCSRRSMPR